MTAPIATGILILVGIIGLIVVKRLSKRPYYQAIPAGVDPLDEGKKGWSGLSRRLHAGRLVKMLYVLGALAVFLYGWVGLQKPAEILWDAYHPSPTPTATLVPTATPIPTMTETPPSIPTLETAP